MKKSILKLSFILTTIFLSKSLVSSELIFQIEDVDCKYYSKLKTSQEINTFNSSKTRKTVADILKADEDEIKDDEPKDDKIKEVKSRD